MSRSPAFIDNFKHLVIVPPHPAMPLMMRNVEMQEDADTGNGSDIDGELPGSQL